MSNRVSKKITTPFQQFNPDTAILVINMIDPQIATMKVFLQAINDNNLPFIAIANKMDAVKKSKLAEVEKTLALKLIPVSTATGLGIKKVSQQIKQKFAQKSKVVVLGVFNAGKTSLISQLTGLELKIGDIPGTTAEFTQYPWNSFTLIDTVGQLIDVNKPLMVSVDLSDCQTLTEKIGRILRQDAEAILATLETAVPQIKKVVKVIKKQLKLDKKIIVIGAGASALVAMEIAGQGMETGLPILVFTNNLTQAQPVSFSKGTCEEEAALSRYIDFTVNREDIVIGISASGGTGFVYHALEKAQNKQAITVSITENPDTPMGKFSDYIIKSHAKPEGPSSSKIQSAHLAIGHALILALADERNISADDSVSYMLPEKVLTKKMGIK